MRDLKFLLHRELSFEFERRFPDRFIPRYSTVMFQHDVACQPGKVQAQIPEDLTACVESLAQLNPADAEAAAMGRLDCCAS